MALPPGTRLGPFEVAAQIGVGGMGEVYRATDTNLGRQVAIKVLPEAFAQDADRLARFEREAKTLASLNHTNIAQIYGLERSLGTTALVMELVEGPTLADRIAQGAIPIDEALPVAKQIAEALEAAHEHGIIHRDLKPANIKLRPDGTVKVLDFGLAKALESRPGAVDVSQSPTFTSPAMTGMGIILGTAAYMSPEQAKGKPVDKRADIWAFGVVVFEMLTGRILYSGETVSETMAQVMMKEPDWSALQASTPVPLRELLRRCLIKEPRNRIRDIGDARITIEEAIAHPQPQTSTDAGMRSAAGPGVWRQPLPWLAAAALGASLVLVAWAPWRQVPAPPGLMRLTAELGVDASLTTGVGAAAFLSPDGKVLAFVATNAAGKGSQLYVRRFDQLHATPLAGTVGARNAFFSPDGQWIAFFADGKLKKISVNGGAAVTLSNAEGDRGGAWGDDGSIVFAPNSRSGLMRIPSTGGEPKTLTTLDQRAGEITHRWPQILPGSEAVMFITSSLPNNYEDANIVVQALQSGERKIVQRGYYPHYALSGHLVYLHQDTLFAMPFNIDRLEPVGEPVPVLENVTSTPGNGASQVSFSSAGAVAYLRGGDTNEHAALFWMAPDGKTQPLRGSLAGYLNPRFSPDGRRIAFEIANDVWVYEWERDTTLRLTSDPFPDRHPAWTPDGKRIAFSSQRGDKSTLNLYWQRADGSDEPQRLTDSKNPQTFMSWHPSGKFLAFSEIQPQTALDIMILPMSGDESTGWNPGKPTGFLVGPFQQYAPAFSPDGRWLAYTSSESTQDEVYVRPFPGPGGRWQISTTGGMFPTWSKNGNELFYRTPDSRIMVASYKIEGDTFHPDKPHLWSEGQFTGRGIDRNFDLHPDGQRFAVLKTPDFLADTKLDTVTLIFNFFDELRRIAPPAP